MTERNRMIEIIEKARLEAVGTIGSRFAAWYADKLMEAGVTLVVHGEWIHHYYDSGEPIDDKWYCSECHMCNDHYRTLYCPICGAKMDGGGQDA